MSRRKKSATKEKKSDEDAAGDWSEEEKSRLTDALKRDDGKNNWRWITRQVKTKTVTQVKEFASKLNTEKQAISPRAPSHQEQSKSASGKRPIAPKDDGPLEGWINATKRLRGENDVDGTCIPQNERSRTQEHRDSSEKKANTSNEGDDDNEGGDDNEGDDDNKGDNDNEEVPQEEFLSNDEVDQPESVLPPDSVSGKMDSVMTELLANQTQMMEKITLLDSKLGNLQSGQASQESAIMDMLNKINSRLDQLYKNGPHGFCSGSVIIQTSHHANVVHQPILDSCSYCGSAKQGESCSSSLSTASNGESVAHKVRNDPASSNSFGRASAETSSIRSVNSECPPSILVPTTRDSFSITQTVVSTSTCSTTPPCVTSHSSNALPMLETSKSVDAGGHSLMKGAATPVLSHQSLPVNNKEQLTQADPSAPGTKETERSSSPNVNRSLVFNQSPTITSTVNTKSIPMENHTTLRQCKEPVSELSDAFAPSQQNVTLPHRQTGGSSVTDLKAVSPKKSLQFSYIDLHKPLTNSPVMTTAVRSSAAAMNCIPVGNSSEYNRSPQNTPVVVNNSSTGTPLQKSSHEQSSRILLHSATAAMSAKSSIPPGFITLSHANLTPTANKVHVTSPLQTQQLRMTSQNPSQQAKGLSPAAGTIIKKSVNDSSTKWTATSPKEIMNAAMLISNYVTEHPNKECQAQWQSCLSAIVTDYHKSRTPSRGDMQQLVSIGYNPYVSLMQFELEDMLEKAKGRPKFFALRLAEKLFGIDVLVKSTPYGIGNKDALHPAILDAIKVEVIKRFAADMSVEAQTALWKGCVTSIAQRCKRARNPRKNRSFKGGLQNDDDLGPPSMAVEGGMLREEQEDSQSDSEDEDEDYESGSLEQPTARNTPPLVHIPSDHEDEREASKNVAQDAVVCISDSKSLNVVTENSNERLESSGKSGVQEIESEGNKRDIPPGIDPDITVVHLPSSLQMSVESPRAKGAEKVTSPVRQNSVVSRCSDSNMSSKTAEEIAIVKAVETVSDNEACDHETNGTDSQEKDTSVEDALHGDLIQMAQSIHRLGASPGAIAVSGIRMTPDYTHVLVGGNPNVALSRQKYLDALTRSSQPTHFAVRLAELAFGEDILVASTVTGGKRGTLQLDPIVINAIQGEVTGRFLKDLPSEQQNVVWRKCVTSIATRCKTLRYNRSKAAESQWKFNPSQHNSETLGSLTPQQN